MTRSKDPTNQPRSTSLVTLSAAILLVGVLAYSISSPVAFAKGPKVTICHIPLGNPENAHTINVSESALQVHLDHSDSVGACQPTGNDGGISPETEAQIDDIQDKINNPNFGLFEIKAEIIELLNAVEAIQITTDNHYVPFTALTTTRVTCDLVDGGSAPSVGQVRIRGSATTGNYIVTGVYMSPDGLNGVSDTDFIKLRALSVDGATVGFSISDNLVGNTNGSSSFDLMWQPLKDGGTFPHQIEVVNNVLIEITCNAGTTGSGLGFLANSIKISGWKQVDDEIVVDFLGEI